MRAALSRGLIPAHAGKTEFEIMNLSPRRAHPRSRGENHIKRSGVSQTKGSSPLTRGKPPLRLRSSAAAGLIPAHAGKTDWRRPELWLHRAHPRSRGENPLVARRPCRARGLIPAHAGKTPRRVPGHSAQRAHPRSRGENGRLVLIALSEAGSSPLTRGKPDL